MDPNANLREQLNIASHILNSKEHQNYGTVRLAELVAALDEWLSRDGVLPDRWERTK
jgi:hypothetical protein